MPPPVRRARTPEHRIARFVCTDTHPVPRDRQEITSVVECRTLIPNVPSHEAGEAAIATSPTDAPADMCGIGLQFKSSGGMPEVFAVKPESPCIALDILAGDILTHVDSAPIAKGTAPRCILDLIRGPSGVQVKPPIFLSESTYLHLPQVREAQRSPSPSTAHRRQAHAPSRSCDACPASFPKPCPHQSLNGR